MMRTIPVISLILPMVAVVAKFVVCGKLHAVVVKLHKAGGEVNIALARDILGASSDLTHFLTLWCAASMVLAVASFRGKLCGGILASFCFAEALLGICFMLFAVS